jgi:hypothetical protein
MGNFITLSFSPVGRAAYCERPFHLKVGGYEEAPVRFGTGALI